MGEAIEAAKLDPAFLDEVAAKMKNFDFANCLACGMCTAGCVYSDIEKSNDPRKFVRKVVLGLREEVMNDPFVWTCNMCERCHVECPMNVNIAGLTRLFRGQTDAPGLLQHIAEDHKRSGNQMDVSQQDFDETLEWIQEELQAELDDPDYRIPLDVSNADFMFAFNAREIKYYPHELQAILKIFHAAGANYTISTKRWDATNIALFSGKNDDFWAILEPLFQEVVRLQPKELVVTECGHAFRSVRMGYRNFWKGQQFPIRWVVELYADWIREGRIKVDKTKNQEPATLHDPCNIVRKEGIYDAQRYVMENIVADFRDMNPNKKYNICCGAGGGFLAVAESKGMRMNKAKRKVDQLVATGAKIGAIPCHNCMDQFVDMNKEYKLGMKMEHISAILERALVMPDKEGK